MQNGIAIPARSAAEAEQDAAWWTVLAAIGALTLYRVILALFDQTDLSTDEAQYWFWGQSFSFGAYSKPPLIGWISGFGTWLLGQSVWAMRLPAALFHGATAVLILLFAARIAPAAVAALAALSYLTTPAVALGSALMTTDTALLFAAALALLAQERLATARQAGQGATGWALLFGFALGLGLLAKHAMLFWLAGSVVAGAISPRLRPRAGDTALAATVMLAMILPHLLWLARHDFITLHHVQDITRETGLSLLRPLSFLLQQAGVIGPVLFVAILLAALDWRRTAWAAALTALMLAPLLVVLAQGVKGPVLANWAILYLVPASVLAAFWLARHRRLAQLSLGIGLALSLALPLVKVFGTDLPGPGGQPLLARYLGHGPVAHWAIDTAQDAGAGSLIARDRSLLADLSWFGAESHLAFRALPPQGRPTHHWEATAPFAPATDPVPALLLWSEGMSPPCPDAVEISRFEAPPGAYGGRSFVMLRLDRPECLAPKETAHD